MSVPKRGEIALPLDLREGCHPKAEVSQVQSLEKPNHNPEKFRQPSLFIRTLLAESMLTAQVSIEEGTAESNLRKQETQINGNPLMSKRSFRGLLSVLLPEAGVACGGRGWAFT